MVVFLAGCVTQVVVACKGRKGRKGKNQRDSPTNSVENVLSKNEAKDIVDNMISSVEENSLNREAKNRDDKTSRNKDKTETDERYGKLHNEIDGGLQLLVNTGFSLLSTTADRHRLATLIFTQEQKLHKSLQEVHQCLRRKGGSSQEMALCLDHIEHPTCRKRFVSFITERPLNCVLRSKNILAKTFAALLLGIFPIAKVTFYMWDFFKDTAFVIYLMEHRWNWIEFQTIKGLIIAYCISVIAASLTVCCNTQLNEDNGIVNVNKIKGRKRRRLVRVLLLVLTPIVPIVIIFKSVHLTWKIKNMVANWKTNHKGSPSSAWMEINILEKKESNVKAALYQMKNAEANLEGFVQLFVLICFQACKKRPTQSAHVKLRKLRYHRNGTFGCS